MRWLLVLLCACNAPLVVEDVSDLPIREWTLGLPVTGEGYLLGVIAREGNDWSTARGGAFFICHDCTLGNDKTKLDFTHTTLDTAFWEENGGIDFGHLEFDRVVAKIRFADGRYRFTAEWSGEDFELAAEVSGALAHDADDIELDGCVQFHATDTLLERDPRTHAVVSLTGAPLDTHGGYDIKLEGTLGGMKRLGMTCSLALR